MFIYRKSKQYITFFLIVLIGFSSQALNVNDGISKTGKDEEPTFKGKDISTFSSWVSNQMIHANVPFDMGGSIYLDQYLSRISYIDTSASVIYLSTEFTINRNGKVSDCKISDSSNKMLNDEVERVILSSRDWKAARQQGKRISSRQQLNIPIKLDGNIGLLDQGPIFGKGDRKNYGKGLNINQYLNSIVKTIYQFHQNEVRGIKRGDKNPNNRYSITGTLELSFVIDKSGFFSDLESRNNIFPVNYGWFVEVHSSSVVRGGFFNREVKWLPAMKNGHPVSVKVKAFLDYDKRKFSWDCYVINEK